MTYSPLRLLDIDELDTCYASSNCYNKLLYMAPYNTTVRYLYLSEKTQYSNQSFELG